MLQLAILKDADLSTVSTKSIRRALEAQTGTSLDSIKKEINAYISEVFVKFQQQQEERKPSLSPPAKSRAQDINAKVVKKTTSTPIKKPAQKKKKEVKEKRVIDWPLYKVSPPLSDIIKTDLVSWEILTPGVHTDVCLCIVFTSSDSKEDVGVH